MKAYTNATLIMRDHLIPGGTLLTDDGKIVELGEARRVTIPAQAEVVDVGGQYLGPGLIDIHCHAGNGCFIQKDPQRAAAYHLKDGTTSLLPAVYFAQDKAGFLRSIATIKAEMGRNAAKIIRGFYMEGPYLNPKYGANRENNPWKAPVATEQFAEIVQAAGELAKVWCIAPEREGIETFVEHVHSRYPAALFSVAHSEAEPGQIERFIPLGLRCSTHHTNATGTLQNYPECRGVCVDETVNYNADIYAEVICDKRGIHVDPYMLRLIRKIKGPDRLILISDSSYNDGPVPEVGDYEGADDINFDHTGEISGSTLTLSAACRNMMKHTGASLCDVFGYASTNPARLLGWWDKGELRRGAVADLIVTDHMMNVRRVIMDGETVSI